MSNPKIAAPVKERIFYADLLRVISAFAVVLLHVAAYQWYDQKPATLAWQSFNAYDGLARFCVPIFIMLSGMFFLDPEKSFNLKKLFTKTLPRVLVALVVWGLLYKLLGTFEVFTRIANIIEGHAANDMIATRAFTWGTFRDYFKAILSGDAWYHLWFLYLIIGLYVLVPVLRVFTQHATRRQLEYYLLLSLVAVGGFSIFNAIAPGGWNIASSAPMLSVDAVFAFAGYTAFFVAGYYFKRYDLSRKLTLALMGLGLAGVAVTVLGSSYYAIKSREPSGMFYAEFYINNMFYTAAVFVLAKKIFTRHEPSLWLYDVVNWMAPLTFGVYLVHVLFISLVFDAFGLQPMDFCPIISVPVLTALVFGLSLVMARLLHKIPWLSRWLL